MKKDKKRQKMQETLSTLDGVLAALDAYPDLEDALLEKAQGEMNKYMGQLFPTQLDFAKDILEHLVGTDVLIEIVSKFLTGALPGVEVALKSALLANMQNLGANCTIDPIIYEKAIKEGVIFDLRQIDLYDKLTVSPLDKKIGQYFYFGAENCESSYDVLMSAIDPNNQSDKVKKELKEKGKSAKSGTTYMNRALSDSVGHYFGARKRDFDCLLWYMKNKAVTRQVWGKRTSKSESIFTSSSNISDTKNWLSQKGDQNRIYYQIGKGDGGKSIIYEFKDGSWRDKQETIQEKELDKQVKEYVYHENGKYYRYYYGNPPIKKIDRNKTYVSHISDNKYMIFVFDDKTDSWNGNENALVEYFNKEKIVEKKLKVGDHLLYEGTICWIKSIDTTKKNVKLEKSIEIPENYKTTDLYVDYDQVEGGKKKGDIIKEGGTPTSSFGNDNTGKLEWDKTKVNATQEKNIDANTIYFISNGNKKEYVIPLRDVDGKPYIDVDPLISTGKYTKDFGVLTLEYSPRTGNVKQSDGNPMRQQTPYDNVLHVFFGNVKELPEKDRQDIEDKWKTSSDGNKIAQNVVRKFENLANLHYKVYKHQEKVWKKKKDLNSEDEREFRAHFLEGQLYYNFIRLGGEIKFNNGKDVFATTLPDEYKEKKIDFLVGILSDINTLIDTYKDQIYTGDTEGLKGDDVYIEKIANCGINYSVLDDFIKALKNRLAYNTTGSDKYYLSVNSIVKRVSDVMNTNETEFYLSARKCSYPTADKNYYMKRTLFEFNADYINSLQLFDPKVLAAQMITSLFGGITISAMLGATASWKTELIRDVVKDMVEKQIAAEDFAVSDCFFTFTNDAYNGMLRAADLRQAGLYSKHGEENGNNTIDPAKLLEGLNEMSNCADKAGEANVIKGAIMNAVGEVSKDVYAENNYMAVNTNYGITMSFIDTLMINLCTQLVMAMLSPKVYLLILINLEMFGMTTNFDIKAFIQRFESLIRSIVKTVVDQFMSYLTQQIMEIVEELVQKLIKKLAFEQVEMYARLLKQILMHLRMLTSCGKGVGWTQDVVENADIVQQDTQEPIDEC